ncbi:hypothetical protein RPIT_07365 [Tessaracoccus flavus]|uniref:Restriction endonuclease type IV Mrr domain-containing protein n=1 Tax=Tessaracoccus flavus TaxID=1610493 RepID=A0A1Q2CF01_9ACTN|nr:hypothetical protein RPIT_07365 [Tessaracoccus flavus]
MFDAVRREIGPQIRPRDARLEREAAQHRNATVLLVMMTLASAGLRVGLVTFRDAEWMPAVGREFPLEALGWAMVALTSVTVLSWVLYLVASWRASRRIRKLRKSLLGAAYEGALQSFGEVGSTTADPAITAVVSEDRFFDDNQGSTAMSPRAAEHLAAYWMRTLGAVDAEVTRFRGDGGVDVTSSRYIAQVKHFSSNVGVAPIRELSGVVRLDGRRGLFFTTAGYSSGAIEFANASGIALFVMDWANGRLMAVNDIARALQRHRLEA